MNPIQVRTLKPGTMPKASEWNALVIKARRGQPSQAGFDWANGTSYKKKPNPFRQQTIFYTPVEIPAYSVFPVKVRTNSGEPFQVCEFDKTEIADYADGFWGTNGRFAIPKQTSFYGWLLDENHDDPIAVYSENITVNVGDECGLSERAEFKADPDAQGMIITGLFSTGVYYVRKMNRFPDFFATLNDDYTVEDGTYTSVTLEDPETFIGESTIEKVYPAWNIDLGTTISGESRVIVKFDTKRGKWFFFKPVGGADGKVLDVWGNPLNVYGLDGQDEVTTFYTEMAAGESVASDVNPLSITAVSQSQEATGSETSDVWIKYPTNYITTDETPLWWRYEPNYRNDLYQWETTDTLTNVKTYHIAPVKYYGQVIKGSSVYYLPKYRTINGQRYWETESGGTYIYYTQKGSDVGYCIGQNLGKFLLSTDSEPFAAQTSDPSDSLEALMTAQSLTYEKPEWTSANQFDVYTANANTSGTVQFGCGRWEATDGRMLSENAKFYFVHVCDGTVNKWKGKYVCQAFNQEFSSLYYAIVFDTDLSGFVGRYIIGGWTSGPGCYYSSSAPSTSAAVTFTYREGVSGLKATLKYVSTSNGSETWEMKCGPVKATYLRDENDLENLVYQSATGGDYYFRNISKSNSTWTAAGLDGTVGTLVFSGADLSKETENTFIFNHSISLTLADYVQGNEKRKAYLCSPGVIS